VYPTLSSRGLKNFSHRAPVEKDYDQGYPIVEISLDSPRNTQDHYDDGGLLVLPEDNHDLTAQLAKQLLLH
jgi:hypothetical protein